MRVYTPRTAYRRDLKREIRSQDYFLLAVLLALFAFSVLSLANCTAAAAPQDATLRQKIALIWASRYVRLQVIWFLTGGVLLLLATFLVDYEFYGRIYLLIFALNVLVLAVLWIVGESTRGAVSWFTIGRRGLQPSEFCKLALIICLAWSMSDTNGRITQFRQLIRPMLIFLIPFALILLQPDLGTALVYVAILVGMLFIAGVNWKIMLTGIAAAALALPLAVKYILNDTQRARLEGFFGTGTDAANATYQLRNSQMAIGSGGLSGRGLLAEGTVSQLDYVPDQHTDFIFSTAAEAFGFIGAVIILVLYLLLLLRLLYMAYRTPDRFGKLLITGVASMFFFHIFENIGMTIGLMPITGIPLPFMSYGGSNMWTNMIAVGLAQNAYCRRNRVRYDNKGIIRF